MKHARLCSALLALLIAGCSTPKQPTAGLAPTPTVEPAVEAKVRAFLTGVIDDIAALAPKHPELTNFRAEIVKNQPHMLMSRPNVLAGDGKPSSFPPLGFTYSYNAVMAPGKPPLFAADGCLIVVKFYGTDPGLNPGGRELYRGQGVQGRWDCSGSSVDTLKAALRAIIEKHADALAGKPPVASDP